MYGAGNVYTTWIGSSTETAAASTAIESPDVIGAIIDSYVAGIFPKDGTSSPWSYSLVSAGSISQIIPRLVDGSYDVYQDGVALGAFVSSDSLLIFSASGGDFVVAAAGTVGACCVGAVCSIETSGDCGGTYQGNGTDCDPDPCSGTPTGACCAGGSCSIATEVGCSGVYQGDSTTCSPNPCVQRSRRTLVRDWWARW